MERKCPTKHASVGLIQLYSTCSEAEKENVPLSLKLHVKEITVCALICVVDSSKSHIPIAALPAFAGFCFP